MCPKPYSIYLRGGLYILKPSLICQAADELLKVASLLHEEKKAGLRVSQNSGFLRVM